MCELLFAVIFVILSKDPLDEYWAVLVEFQRSVDETEEWLRFHISLAVVAN